MAEVSRERIALVVFTACLLLIAGGVVMYLYAGHSWNHAASHIDNVTGEMDGYTVVLFEGTAIPAKSRVDSRGELTFAPVSLARAQRDYAEKGARVFSVDALHPERYSQPLILGKDGYRIGVVDVAEGDAIVEVQAKVDYLRAHDVEGVLAIVPTESSIAQIEGIDVFLDQNERSPLSAGKSSADGYRISMPTVGTVGAIVISPNEVVSGLTVSG